MHVHETPKLTIVSLLHFCTETRAVK